MMVSPEVKEAVEQVILLVLSGIVTVVVPMAYRLLKAWGEAKIAAARAQVASIADEKERAEAEAKLRLVEYSFKRIDFIVGNTVKEIAQTAAINSNLAPEDAKRRLQLAYSRVKKQLPADLEETVKTVVKDFDRYLITKIEASRFDQKQGLK